MVFSFQFSTSTTYGEEEEVDPAITTPEDGAMYARSTDTVVITVTGEEGVTYNVEMIKPNQTSTFYDFTIPGSGFSLQSFGPNTLPVGNYQLKLRLGSKAFPQNRTGAVLSTVSFSVFL